MLLVDGRGIPLSIIVTAANHHDVTQLEPVLDAIVRRRPRARAYASPHIWTPPALQAAVFASGFRIGLQTIYPAFSASVDAGPDDIRSQRPQYYDGV
jgi:hypothetical protein